MSANTSNVDRTVPLNDATDNAVDANASTLDLTVPLNDDTDNAVDTSTSTLDPAAPSNDAIVKADNPKMICTALPADCCDTNPSLTSQFDTEMPRLNTYEEFKNSLCDMHIGHFTYVKDSTSLTFVKLSDDINPNVEISVVVGDDFRPYVHVWGKSLTSKSVPEDILLPTIDCLSKIVNLLEFLAHAKLCSGVTEDK